MSLSGFQTVNGGAADRDADALQVLVYAHQAGDPEAFARLVRLVFPSLYRHALNRLLQPQAAEDAVQEALLRAYRGLPSFRGDYRVSAWLHRILANVCADEANRRRREAATQARLGSLAPGPQDSADDRIARQDVVRAMGAAVRALPARYREALMLRDYMEMDYADVAEQVGISEQNARARVSRARGALRRMLDSSAVRGSPLLVLLRRIGRGTATGTQTVASAAVAPDVIAAPARLSIAATSVAVAVAAAMPAMSAVTAGPTGRAPNSDGAGQPTSGPVRPHSLAVSSEPAPVTVLVAASGRLDPAAPPIGISTIPGKRTTSSSTSTTTTSTTTLRPPPTAAPVSPKPPPSNPDAGSTRGSASAPSGGNGADASTSPAGGSAPSVDNVETAMATPSRTFAIVSALSDAPPPVVSVAADVRVMTGVGVATVVDHQFGSLVVNDGIVVLVGEAGPCGRPTWIQLTTPLPGSGSFLTMIRGWASASPGNTNALSFVGVASGPTGGPDVVLNGAVAARILGPSGGAPGSFDLATASDQGAPDSTCALPPLITPFSPAASSS